MEPQRYHIIIDVSHVSKKILSDMENLQTFLSNLPARIGMHILYGPVVIKGVPANPGVTGFVIIDFSHISMHTFTDYDKVLVDIFSCKPYQQEVALNAVLDFFHAKKSQAKIQEVAWGK